MAYRLRMGNEPVPRQLERILIEEVDAALAALLSGTADNRDQGIHEARKSIKKSRALLRLMAPHLGKRKFHEANSTYRDIGRWLSELRDSQAMIESFAALPDALLSPYRRKKFQKRLVAAKAAVLRTVNVDGVIGHAIEQLRVVRSQPITIEVEAAGFSALEAGMVAIYRRGRRDLRRAQQDPAAEKLHDFRKRVKDQWYHIRLLSGSGVLFVQQRQNALRELEGLLGDSHNLHVLRSKLREGGAEVALERALLAQEEAWGAKALVLGEELYELKPKHFAEQFAPLRGVWMADAGLQRKGAQKDVSSRKRRSVSQLAS